MLTMGAIVAATATAADAVGIRAQGTGAVAATAEDPHLLLRLHPLLRKAA
jgi:hypothetical protein